MKSKKLYIYGFGNPGRQDDALGPAVIDRLDEDNFQGIITDSNYQLNVEDAYEIGQCDEVIFVDASLDAPEPFLFTRLEPDAKITFTTHSVSPGSVLALSNELFGQNIKGWVLAVRGYEWELSEGLSAGAVSNFNLAYRFLVDKIKEITDCN